VGWLGSDRGWAVVGRLETLLAIVAAGLTVYSWASASKAELIGYASYFMYMPSPEISDMVSNIRNSQSRTYTISVKKALENFKEKTGKVVDEYSTSKPINDWQKSSINYEILSLVNDIFSDILPATLNKSIWSYKGILHFYIENTGDELAKDVTLRTPFDGIAYISSESMDARVVQVQKSIEIGSISQDDFVRVYMWSTEAPTLEHQGFFRLTHSSGIGTILFPVSGFGPIYRIVHDYFYLVLFGIGLLLIGSLLGLLFMIEHLTGMSIITYRASE
jgi:hypothetical protein